MLLWALKRAADAEWLIPSQNFHEGFSTQDISAQINETDHSDTRAVMQAPEILYCRRCREAMSLNSEEFNAETEVLADEAVLAECPTRF